LELRRKRRQRGSQRRGTFIAQVLSAVPVNTIASNWTSRALALLAAGSLASSACSFTVPLDGLAGGGSGSSDDAGALSVTSGGTDAGVALSNPKGAAPSDAGSAAPPPSGQSGIADSGSPDGGGVLVDASMPDSAPPTACSKGLARVFVTSSMSSADFGGVSGADAVCQERVRVSPIVTIHSARS
jgi:hypothetical protein